jgi:hypothetical protein
MDGQDVRVGEPGRNPDLVDEPLAEDGGQLGVEYFQRDRTVVAEIVGLVDRRHPAATKRALDAVAVGQGGLKISDAIRHGK